jgi:hypothetical protein
MWGCDLWDLKVQVGAFFLVDSFFFFQGRHFLQWNSCGQRKRRKRRKEKEEEEEYRSTEKNQLSRF